MQILNSILGYAADEPFDSALHDLSHAGKVEYLTISPEDTSRRRMKVITNKGTECAIALNRDQQLSDGAVLNISADRAIECVWPNKNGFYLRHKIMQQRLKWGIS